MRLKTRTLKVSILALFLSLFLVAFLVVLGFTHFQDLKSSRQYAKEVAAQSTAIILAKFQTIASSVEQAAEVSVDFFPALGPLNVQNTKLIAYLLNCVKYDPNVANYGFGLPNGDMISAISQEFTPQQTYLTDPSKPLPKEAKFAVRFLNASESPQIDHWTYLNQDFQEVAKESVPVPNFHTSRRPWFVGAVQTKHLFWTGLYPFVPTYSEGISVGNPMYDGKGELLAVITIDLTFVQLSNFLCQQKVGRTGRAFIVDKLGKIIAPIADGESAPEVVSLGFNRFMATPEQSDYIVKGKGGEEFYFFVAKLPVIFGADWYIVTAAPTSDYFGQWMMLQMQAVGSIVGVLLLSMGVIFYFAKRISAPIAIFAEEVDKISRLDLQSGVSVSTNITEIYLMDRAIASMRGVVRSFAKYVPKEIIKDLFQKKEEIVLGGELKEVTIFFSDIAGFTAITESHSTDFLIPLLGSYFDALSKIILELHGTIDKFLGDGIMAFWGAPISFPDHAERACVAALRCNAYLAQMNQKHRLSGLPEFVTRFGINTGTVIVGNMGTEERMNYTAVGDAVNTTALLQEADKTYHTSILIGEDVASLLGEEFIVRPLDEVTVKGKRKKIKIFELVGRVGEQQEICPQEDQINLCRLFTEAYAAMQRKDLLLAKKLFAQLQVRYPEDYPTQIYLERIHNENI